MNIINIMCLATYNFERSIAWCIRLHSKQFMHCTARSVNYAHNKQIDVRTIKGSDAVRYS